MINNYDFEYLVSEFLISKRDLYNLKIKTFDKPDEEWLKYVVNNRSSSAFSNKRDYDVVIGPVVDGKGSWIYLNKYRKKEISVKGVISKINPNNLKDQYTFKTEKSIKLLKYRGVIYENK